MLGPKSDEILVHRARAGSERAWLTLVRRYETSLYNYSLRMSSNPDDAMDILQDVLLSVYRNLDSFRGDGPFRAWLFRIASFRCTDFLRRRYRQPVFQESEEANAPDNVADDRHDLQRMLMALSPDERQLVELKFFQSFTFVEISAQLGIPSNTAKTRIYSALRKLRRNSQSSNDVSEQR